MERALTRFIRALRSAGADVSSTEAIDAARTVALVGYADREVMKTSLSMVLAKSEEEKVLHDHLFDVFFKTVDSAPKRDQQQDPNADSDEGEDNSNLMPGQGESQGQGSDDQNAQASADDTPTDDAGGDPDADQIGRFLALASNRNPAQVAMAMQKAATAVGADEIRFASQTGYFVRRMLEQLGVEALERRLLDKLDDPSPASQAQAQELIDARMAVQQQARAHIKQRYEVFGRSATENFMNETIANRSIDQLEYRDLERMKFIVARMAKRLAVRHSRKRRIRNRGRLDIGRTLRASAANDWVPVDLIWRNKRKDRPKIVAICDVSGSVASYVRFLLLFLHTLRDEVSDVETFAFSNKLHDVGDILARLSPEAAMDRIVDVAGSGSTDYGQALAELQESYFDSIDRRTTVIILGDGRSNHSDPRLDIVQEIADRAKRLVWLCPEPPMRWGTGDSCMLRYEPLISKLYHCATAADLERAVDDVMLAYD
jgi:uncharacterized protein with von Willebrand factor type A (vWA) domain